MFAVKHLSFLLKNVTVLLYFQQGFLDEFFVHWALRAGVVVKGSSPFAEEFVYEGVVSVS